MQAVCDLNEPEMHRWADDLGVPERYTRYQDLLESNLDFVYVATPPALHATMSIQALAAGRHVLCEVPAVTTIEEGRALVEAAEASGKLYMLAENYCYRRDVQALAAFVRRGELGSIVYARGCYTHDVRGHLDEWRRKGIRDWFLTYEWPRYITHAMGPLLYVTGDRVIALSALAGGGRIRFGDGKPVFTSMQCRTERGAVFQLIYGLGIDRHEICYSFTGDTGTVESLPLAVSPLESNPPLLGDAPYRLTRMNIPGEPDLYYDRMIDLDPGHPFNDYRGGSHWESDLCMLATFAECIRDGDPSPIDARRGLDFTLPGIRALDSTAAHGAWIDVSAL